MRILLHFYATAPPKKRKFENFIKMKYYAKLLRKIETNQKYFILASCDGNFAIFVKM